jgi:peptide/nickel transport system substrate-binding protein/microcin C transport system substrate-binding protein
MNSTKTLFMTGLIGFCLLGFVPRLCDANASAYFSKQAGETYRRLPDSKKSGALHLNLINNPRFLVPYLAHDQESQKVIRYLFAPLMSKDFETGEYFPNLAEKLDVSKDRKTLTLTLRKDAVWEDGSPITTDDAEFSFQTLMDPKVDAAPTRSYFQGFSFEKVDGLTFRLHVEHPNVNTVSETLDDFRLIQKKQFASVPDFNKSKEAMAPVTSGPYRIKSFSRDQKLELELKKEWWGFKIPEFKNLYNFESLVFKIIPDSTLAYEKFIKGDLDVYEMNPEIFGMKVKGVDQDKFGIDPDTAKAVWARHFTSDAPALWSFIGWNLKQPVFESKKTRQALARLIDYDLILDKVYHGEATRCLTPFGTRTPNLAPDQRARAFRFEPKKALSLLIEDGWSDRDQTGILAKTLNGKKVNFEFTLRYNSENPMRAKIAQMIKEQFKQAGIQVKFQALEFNALLDSIDRRDFDAVVMGWGSGPIHADAKQSWHSSSASDKGSNWVSYSNSEVDQLIDQASVELNVQKHFKLNQKIGALIYDDQPYAFLAEVPGLFIGFKRDRVKSRKWVTKYEESIPIWMYSPEP